MFTKKVQLTLVVFSAFRFLTRWKCEHDSQTDRLAEEEQAINQLLTEHFTVSQLKITIFLQFRNVDRQISRLQNRKNVRSGYRYVWLQLWVGVISPPLQNTTFCRLKWNKFVLFYVHLYLQYIGTNKKGTLKKASLYQLSPFNINK